MSQNVYLTSDTNPKASKLLDPVVTTPTPHGLMQFHHMSRLKTLKKPNRKADAPSFLASPIESTGNFGVTRQWLPLQLARRRVCLLLRHGTDDLHCFGGIPVKVHPHAVSLTEQGPATPRNRGHGSRTDVREQSPHPELKGSSNTRPDVFSFKHRYRLSDGTT